MLRPRLRFRESSPWQSLSVDVMLLLVATGTIASPLPAKDTAPSSRTQPLNLTTEPTSLSPLASSRSLSSPPPFPDGETVLAFELVPEEADEPLHAQGMPSTRPKYLVSYDNTTYEWSTSDRITSSLPSLSYVGESARGANHGTIDSNVYSDAQQRVTASPGRIGNATLTYKMLFPIDFDFSHDARLPSLYSGRTDCSSCFSTRVRYNADGTGELYMYNSAGGLGPSDEMCLRPGSTCSTHESRIGRGSWTFERNKWTTVRHDVWLNQAGHNDGGFNIWIDDRLVLTANDVSYTGARGMCAPPYTHPTDNIMVDSCLPAPQTRWTFAPAIRGLRSPQTTVTTRILVPTTVTAAPITLTQPPNTVTRTEAVTVPVTETTRITLPAPAPATETTTITVTEAPLPEPTPFDPPVDDEPVEEPVDSPADDPSDGDEPAEESVRLQDSPMHARNALDNARVHARDDGLWKGLHGYPGDAGYGGGAQGPAVPGYPVTLTVQQVVSLVGPPTVTVTKTLPARPTPKPKAPKKAKP